MKSIKKYSGLLICRLTEAWPGILSFTTRVWKVLKLTIALALGFVLPYFLMQEATHKLVSAPKPPKHDTAFVKLINAPAACCNDTDRTVRHKWEKSASDTIANGAMREISGIEGFPGRGRKAQHRLDLIRKKRSAASAVNTAALNLKWLNEQTPSHAPFTWFLIYFIGGFVLIFIVFAGWIYRNRLPRMLSSQKDRDPVELIAIFESFAFEFSKEIDLKNAVNGKAEATKQSQAFRRVKLFDTPRRMKRFSNKLRFQYNLLENKKIIDKDKKNGRAELLVIALLVLEEIQKNNYPDIVDREAVIKMIKERWNEYLVAHPKIGMTITADGTTADEWPDIKIIGEIYSMNKELIIQGKPNEGPIPVAMPAAIPTKTE